MHSKYVPGRSYAYVHTRDPPGQYTCRVRQSPRTPRPCCTCLWPAWWAAPPPPKTSTVPCCQTALPGGTQPERERQPPLVTFTAYRAVTICSNILIQCSAIQFNTLTYFRRIDYCVGQYIHIAAYCESELDHWSVNALLLYENLRQLTFLTC